MRWLRSFFRRESAERQLEAELRFHLEQQTADLVAGGVDPAEARRQAAMALGGLEQTKEQCRDLRRGRWLETVAQDVRYGMRSLRRSPAFTLAALATLAVGIGANTAIFSFVNGVMLKPLPYPEAERIVAIVEKPPTGNWSPISTLNYLDWQKQNTVFEYMTSLKMNEVALSGIGDAVHLLDQQVSAHFFDIFRIRPALGRTFVEGEDQPGHDAVTILTNKVWNAKFGADPAVVGRTILLDGKPTTVIGVLPPGVLDRSWPQIYRPLTFSPEQMTRDSRWLIPAYARLKAGVTLEQARAQMNVIGARLATQYPETNKGWGVNTMMYAGTLVWDELKQTLWVLMAAVGMVLLIACTNLANLSLARGVLREREVAIRAALGAGKARLVQQFFIESLMLAGTGGALGLIVGYLGMAWLKTAPPGGSLPPTVTVSMDGRVLLFALSLSLLTAVVFGLVPALKSARLDLTPALKDGGAAVGGGRVFHRLRSGLIIAEVALAFILLSGAGLLIRSFLQLQKVDAGFDSTNLATAYLPIPEQRFSSSDELTVYLRQVVERIGALPGVSDVALTTAPPINWGWGFKLPFQIVGRKAAVLAERPQGGFKAVSASYLRTLGMRLKEGRWLDEHDGNGSPPVTVISESMARKFFPDEPALGQHLSVQEMPFGPAATPREISWEVVGVVKDEKNSGLRDEDFPGMYVMNEQSVTRWQFLIVRGAMNPVALERAMRQSLRELDAGQVMDNVISFDQVKANSMASERRRSWLLGGFAAVALLLAGMGLYGVISYTVAQRTREIGIRTALGASTGNILRLILRAGMQLTVIGLVIGIGGAMALSRLIAALLFNVREYDPITLTVVATVLTVTAGLACLIPARRAARVDSVVALKCD